MTGCSEPGMHPDTLVVGPGEPDRVEVQDIFVTFGALEAGKHLGVTRNRDEALNRIQEILERIDAGEDFDALTKEYTDYDYPAIVFIANHGVETSFSTIRTSVTEGYTARKFLEKDYGDAAFQMAVDEVRLVEYNRESCPSGWHILKRNW